MSGVLRQEIDEDVPQNIQGKLTYGKSKQGYKLELDALNNAKARP